MGTETCKHLYLHLIIITKLVKLNNPLMGTETIVPHNLYLIHKY